MKMGNLNISGVKLGTTDVDLYLGDKILYKELEYIESTGQQFIATTDVYGPWNSSNDYGYWDAGSEYKIEIKALSYETGQTNQAALVSINGDSGPTIYNNGANPKGVTWKFPQPSLSYFSNVSPAVTDRQAKLFNFDTVGEGTVIYQCHTTSNNFKSYGIALFGRVNSNIEQTDRKIKAKLYYCRIYKDNVLLLDFIPVQTFKGDIGLYDKVNGKFIKSYEGTPFIAGPEI